MAQNVDVTEEPRWLDRFEAVENFEAYWQHLVMRANELSDSLRQFPRKRKALAMRLDQIVNQVHLEQSYVPDIPCFSRAWAKIGVITHKMIIANGLNLNSVH